MSKPDLPDPQPRRPWNPWALAVAWGLTGGLFVGSILIVWTEILIADLPPGVEYHDLDQGRLLRREAARAWLLEQEELRRAKAGALPAAK